MYNGGIEWEVVENIWTLQNLCLRTHCCGQNRKEISTNISIFYIFYMFWWAQYIIFSVYTINDICITMKQVLAYNIFRSAFHQMIRYYDAKKIYFCILKLQMHVCVMYCKCRLIVYQIWLQKISLQRLWNFARKLCVKLSTQFSLKLCLENIGLYV